MAEDDCIESVIEKLKQANPAPLELYEKLGDSERAQKILAEVFGTKRRSQKSRWNRFRLRHMPWHLTLVAGLLIAVTPSIADASTSTTVSNISIPVLQPKDLNYGGVETTLGVLNGRIVVGDNTYYRQVSTCRLITVDPGPLKTISQSATSCNNPALSGESVVPIETVIRPQLQYGSVRIAVSNPKTGKVTLGPVVMYYFDGSDTRPEWAYGGGYLWLFGPETINATGIYKRPPEMLRISLVTGAVLDTVPMPDTTRIVLAPDDDGLWFAQSRESGWAQGSKPPPPISFLPIGSSHITTFNLPTTSVNWLVASGHTAWASMPASKTSDLTNTIDTFHSPSAPPTSVDDHTPKPIPDDLGEGPFDAPTIMKGTGSELVAAIDGQLGAPTGPGPSSVIGINPTTGISKKVGSLGDIDTDSVDGRLVYDNAVYVLATEPASTVKLFRLPISSADR